MANKDNQRHAVGVIALASIWDASTRVWALWHPSGMPRHGSGRSGIYLGCLDTGLGALASISDAIHWRHCSPLAFILSTVTHWPLSLHTSALGIRNPCGDLL